MPRISRARTTPLSLGRLLLTSALLTAFAASAQTGNSATDDKTAASEDHTTQLPEVNVEGRRGNALEDSDRRLRELIDKSTPCIGCDAKTPDVPPSLVDRVVDTATGLVTPQASKPLNHDNNNQREVDRSIYDQRHPSNATP